MPLENKHLDKALTNYIPIGLVFIGTIGNSISFLIFLKLGTLKLKLSFKRSTNLNRFEAKNKYRIKRLESNSCNSLSDLMILNHGAYTVYIFLSILSLLDLSVLYFGLLNDWLEISSKTLNFKLHSSLLCKLIPFFAYVFSHSSSWLVVVVSFIRLLAIYKPSAACQLTRKKNVVKVVLFLGTVLTMVDLSFFWAHELNVKSFADFLPEYFNSNEINSTVLISDQQKYMNLEELIYTCEIKKNKFALDILPILDKLVYCLIPFWLLAIMNFLIIRKTNVKTSKEHKYKYIAKFQKEDVENHFKSNVRSKKKQIKNKSVEYHLIGRKFTIMLLAKSFGFLIFTLPILIMFVCLKKIENYLENIKDLENMTKGYEILYIVQKTTYLLMYLNHSINFFIYFKFSPRFRRILFEFFTWFKKK